MIPTTQTEAVSRAAWNSIATLNDPQATDSAILTATTCLRANAERGATPAIRRLCAGACKRHDIKYRRAADVGGGFILEPGEPA